MQTPIRGFASKWLHTNITHINPSSPRDNRGVGISRLTPISELIDDFALQPMDATATADFYELVVARHQKASTVLTSNRSPDEWLAIMTDPLLAQSAVDRLTSTAHELVIEGQSYRRRQKPSVDTHPKTPDHPQ